jgi:hypothetical protein
MTISWSGEKNGGKVSWNGEGTEMDTVPSIGLLTVANKPLMPYLWCTLM